MNVVRPGVILKIGVGRADWFRPLPPPNRAGGSPAHGSPVSGVTLSRIDQSPQPAGEKPPRRRRKVLFFLPKWGRQHV